MAVSTSVMTQSGTAIVTFLRPDGQYLQTRQELIATPLALQGLSTGHIVKGLQRGMVCSPLDVNRLNQMRRAFDIMIWGMRSDRASVNLSALRHIRSCALPAPDDNDAGDHVDLWHEEFCHLHSVNRIKIMVQDIKNTVANLFCLSNLMKFAKTLGGMVQNLEIFVQHARWLRGVPAPEEATEKNKSLVNVLFDLESGHHHRILKQGTVKDSTLLMDLKQLLSMEKEVEQFKHFRPDDPSIKTKAMLQ